MKLVRRLRRPARATEEPASEEASAEEFAGEVATLYGVRHREEAQALVSVKNVSKSFGGIRAVDGLSLITGGFVVAGFVLAELVLSASSTGARSG